MNRQGASPGDFAAGLAVQYHRNERCVRMLAPALALDSLLAVCPLVDGALACT
jgi:hypothetical protein